MLKYIFKSATFSFSRTLGRILAYITIGALILFLGSFLHLSNVRASEAMMLPSVTYNPVFGSYIDSITYYKDFKTHSISYNNSYISGVGGGNAIGYNWRSFRFKNGFTSSSEGVGLASCGNGFIKDNYYSLILYYVVKDNTFYVHNSYVSPDKNRVGLGITETIALNNMDIQIVQQFAGVNNDLIYDNKYISLNVITFKASKDATCVAWPVNRNGGGLTSSNFEYVGYRISYQGTEPPSNDEVTSLITQESAIINSNIDSMKEKQDETNNKLDDVNNNITNDKVDGAQGSANDFFKGFEDKDYGLSDVITMPLSYINKITSGTCTPLSFPAPFLKQNVTLPCMYDIYQTYFGDFLSIYQTITFGIVSYWVCINIFHMVKNFKDPNNDEVEVLDL